MAWEARSGLKLQAPVITLAVFRGLNGLGSPFGFETTTQRTPPGSPPNWLNGLGSPFGFEINTFFDVPIRNPLNRLNGLGSPFGFETAGFSTDSAYSFGAKWPGKPVRV